MLSPVHEPLSNPYGLPSILSPTLPSSIQAELDRLHQEQRSRAVSSASASSTEPKSQTLAVPKERPQVADKTIKTESRIRSVSVSGKSPYTAPPAVVEDKGPSLIVKLKFSKAKAATVKQVLRLPPKRALPEKKERQDTPKELPVKIRTKVVDEPAQKKPKAIPKNAARRPESSATSAPTPISKPTLPTTKTAEKRPRTDDDASLAVPSKRPRALSSQDRPSTPTVQASSSPALSTKSSATKSQPQYVTPKKDHKAVSLLRTGSSESQDATPGRSGGTPASARPDAKAAPTSAPLNGKKQAEIALIAQTSMKLNQMGRTLKHEATKILTEKGNKVSKQDEKRAAVTNLECILYVGISFLYNSTNNGIDRTWRHTMPKTCLLICATAPAKWSRRGRLCFPCVFLTHAAPKTLLISTVYDRTSVQSLPQQSAPAYLSGPRSPKRTIHPRTLRMLSLQESTPVSLKTLRCFLTTQRRWSHTTRRRALPYPLKTSRPYTKRLGPGENRTSS